MIEHVAHAKINLALHVTGQRCDGYHLLDSIVVFAHFGDLIRVERSKRTNQPIKLVVGGPFAEGLATGKENLIMQAGCRLYNEAIHRGFNLPPVCITLIKNLPVAGGIGGGSADAAATLLALREFWQCPIDVLPIAKNLGADVPMCLQSNALRARGIGGKLKRLTPAGEFSMVLANPGKPVCTPEVFRTLSCRNNPPVSNDELSVLPDMAMLEGMRNDLQQTAIEIVPEIGETLSALSDSGARFCRMSGSGATCFGIYDCMEDAERAADAIITRFPHWWCISTMTTNRAIL